MTKVLQLGQALASASCEQLEAFQQLCLQALDEGLFEILARRLEPEAEGLLSGNYQIWQLLGLARRGLQDSAGAHAAFRRAAQLVPSEPLIAHSLARTALEAGYPSTELFAKARALAPQESPVLLGQAAAMLADGDPAAAIRELSQTLDQHPGWHEGHIAFAKITAEAAPPIDRLASLRRALERYPQDAGLWSRMIEIAMQADDYHLASECVELARQAMGDSSELSRAEAICRNESGDPQGALALFDALPDPVSADFLAHILRNRIRLGRYDEADTLAARSFTAEQDVRLWPYRALIWRLIGDPRWHWLEGDQRLIGTYDIAAAVGPIEQLADVLRAIHCGSGAPIDQSVRGGTQSDGNLLARAEPEIRRLRAALLGAVREHISQLPPTEEGHPTLVRQRDPIRIEGAWSVRLKSGGFHVDHVHPQGWLSSAFYAVLPEGANGIGRDDLSKDGWLTFGECRGLVPDLAPFNMIAPQVGTLVLFPSTMWHGTRPFGAGERISVALDIARPGQ